MPLKISGHAIHGLVRQALLDASLAPREPPGQAPDAAIERLSGRVDLVARRNERIDLTARADLVADIACSWLTRASRRLARHAPEAP